MLVAAAARGDERARRELVTRLLGRVRSTVMYLAARSPDVDDMTQRSLIEVLGSCATYRGESTVEAWNTGGLTMPENRSGWRPA